ncbi:MAG: hypothetical protein IJB88_03105 [Clostridia bacterium]|nr:hypothetical protein [Clostridia bacterium]MBQ3154198.1 hypothetical protein [Clostridia bacterium]
MTEEFGKDIELETDALDEELFDEDLLMYDDDLEEIDEEAAAQASKRKKQIILIAGIALGLAIATALIAIFACKKKDD